MSNQINSVGFYSPTKNEAFDVSIFSEYMTQDDPLVLDWAINVAQKAYDKGYVPLYIERNKSEQIIDDKDYVDFWSAITIIFGYVVNLTRKVGLEDPSQQIFFKYLEQKNLFNAPTELLVDMEYIASNYYDQIRKRGTSQVYKEVGLTGVDGEILRVIDFKINRKDEFGFTYQAQFDSGLTVDRSSPLYCNHSQQIMANKAYEPFSQEGVKDLASYPLVGAPTLGTLDGKGVIQLGVGQGVGGTDLNFEIRINPSLPYRISFMVKGLGNFTFGGNFYDVDNVLVSPVSAISGLDESIFVTAANPLADYWYEIEAILFPYNVINIPADISKTNIGSGQNLKSKRIIRGLIPQITCNSGTISIHSIRVAVADLGWQSSFIHPPNFINLISVNRNGKLTNFDIVEAVRYYMIPYDSVLAVKFIENLDEVEGVDSIDLSEVLLNQTNQGIISGTNLLLYTL